MYLNLGGARWTKLRAKVKKRLAKIEDDGLDAFLRQLEVLAGRIQPAHGIPPDEVERQVLAWQRLLEGGGTGKTTSVDSRLSAEPQELQTKSLAR
jgi:hypothetical protein